MSRLGPNCWIWSPRPPPCLLPQHSESLASGTLKGPEEKEKEAGENPAACCYTAGRSDVISQTGDAQRSTFKPPAHSGIPSSCALAGRSPSVLSSQQPATVIEADQGNVAQPFTGGCCWDGPQMKSQPCVCVYGQREPECVGHCWPGPYIYYGVRRNLVIGVEVVEEVAVEDTVEVITEDVYTDDLLDPEALQDQLYPT